jgi:class 3 adenylate cyclase
MAGPGVLRLVGGQSFRTREIRDRECYDTPKRERVATQMPDELDNPSAQFLERKLATILSADVAEFSRLMGEDEEQTLRTFRGHKQVFESLVAMHRGRIFNTAGDAILAEFSSAVEAVRCATDIQAALRTRNDQLPPDRQVRFRIGINLGDVMLHGQDLLGDGVNVAARLQTAAEPGGICISGSVHDQISNKLSLSFLSLGEMNFKNIQQPVRTFSITETEGRATLPSRKPPPARNRSAVIKWIAAGGLLLLLLVGGGYWIYSKGERDRDTARRTAFENRRDAIRREAPPVREPDAMPPGGYDGLYSGQICYGETRDEPERCYHAEGAIRNRKITSQWTTGREKKVNMLLAGEVYGSGDVKIEIEMYSNGYAARLGTIDLTGTLQGGLITASGSFRKGRAATLNWHKNTAPPR